MKELTREEKQISMYGCTADEVLAMIDDYIGMPEMLAMSILSDAQEMMSRGNTEKANQYINRAKRVMSQVIQNKMAA